ncbi:hypothetical protein SUGI_0479600 [Cryptomeria japonica]|nr:hypothetical protein SUGI_0479600 [Cryptomeria japonica]
MSVIGKLCFLLAVVSLGAAHVYPIYPKNEHTEISSLVERDIQRIGRRLQAAVKTTVSKVQGSAYLDGIYYMSAYIGNPGKEYYLDIDTGSDLTWLQCDAPCRSCAKTPHQLYKVQPKSAVSSKNPLDIFTVRLTNGTIVKTVSVFGCGYDQDGSLKETQATDGILGLSGGIASLPSQWEKQGLTKNVIGICIAGGGNKGGYMFFGDDHVPTSMTWVPLLRGPTMRYYHVGLAQMIYDGKPFAKDGDEKSLGDIIFDSGSTYTYFTEKAHGALVSTVEENFANQLVRDPSDKTQPLCWRGKEPFSSITDPRVTLYFKPLVFTLENANAKFELTPEGYLIISKQGNVCLGILHDTDLPSLNIIGDISFQGYLVVHDNGNNRIGWILKNCTKFRSLAAGSRL